MGKMISIDDDQLTSKNPRPSKNIKKKSPLKITYISSPVTVKVATASEFRAIVQELTGKDSDITGDDAVHLKITAEETSRPIIDYPSEDGNYVAELAHHAAGISMEENLQIFGSDIEGCFWREFSEGFTGLNQSSSHCVFV